MTTAFIDTPNVFMRESLEASLCQASLIPSFTLETAPDLVLKDLHTHFAPYPPPRLTNGGFRVGVRPGLGTTLALRLQRLLATQRQKHRAGGHYDGGTLTGIENLINKSPKSPVTYIGNDADNVLIGGNKNDSFMCGGGNDIADGQGGVDIARPDCEVQNNIPQIKSFDVWGWVSVPTFFVVRLLEKSLSQLGQPAPTFQPVRLMLRVKLQVERGAA